MSKYASGSAPLPISVVILTYNEEKAIGSCLASVDGMFDEIFVVDSGSTDRTREILAEHAVHFVTNPFSTYAQQRNWAQQYLPLRNEWVFHIDADERAQPQLIEQLKQVFSRPVSCNGFLIPRKVFFRKKWLCHGGLYPVYHLRIFKKDTGTCDDRLYDQHYKVTGPVECLSGGLDLITEEDLGVWKRKHARWARAEAMEMALFGSQKRRLYGTMNTPIERKNWLRYHFYYRMPLFFRAIAYFIYRAFLRGGFLDGRVGMAYHVWQALWFRMLVDKEILRLTYKRGGRMPAQKI